MNCKTKKKETVFSDVIIEMVENGDATEIDIEAEFNELKGKRDLFFFVF